MPAECPLLLTSAVAWWPQLEPELRCRWARCASGPLPPELQRLREAQLFGRSALLSDTTPAPAGPAWVSAAALHLSIQRAGPGSTLPQLDALGEELLLFLFFFCVTSLLASRLDPQATLSAQQALGVCAETLRCVQKRRLPWLGLFRVTEMDSSNLAWVLPRLAPDQLLRLLPLAFYSLLPYFDQDSLEGEDTFLPVAVDMYLKLTCLFVSGETGAAPAADGGRQDLQDEDSPVGLLMQARLFLLQMAPRCPRWSRTQAAELLATCGHCDPELSAALPSRQQATPAPEPNCLTHPSHCK
ncbi:Fanconi anemia group A protein-like [Talpa occidentalis]|uniref:Fanconi anemia group A protein-like n=1 Tax=Talpa occidentalis TaxID=50954 RepID=UPI00188F2186|nr:Fanconi anemia group A protein-like [Talpa occidentalis]